MTKKERLIEKFLEQLEADIEQDNVDGIYEICEELIKEAKLKTLEEIKGWYLCDD